MSTVRNVVAMPAGIVQKRPLVDHIRVPMGPAQRRCVERIDAEDFSKPMKKAREELQALGLTIDDTYLAAAEFALKQYHVVAVMDPRNEHAVSDTLDPFWHSQILHTQSYVRFCDDLVGHYIHHEPLDHSDRIMVAHMRVLYPYTCARIRELFDSVDPFFYPVPVPDSRLVCRHCSINSPELIAEAMYPERFVCAH